METIYKFAGRLISLDRVILFLLFALTGLNFYTPSEPIPGYATNGLNVIGGLCFLGWTFAIGQRASSKLADDDINLDFFKYFKIAFIIAVLSFLTMLVYYIVITATSGQQATQFTYTRPTIIAIIFFSSMLFLIGLTAKTMISAEIKREAEFSDYFTTIFLFVFFPIGLWFIQPRAQKL